MNITLIPDMQIEPGHQWIVVENTEMGRSLANVLLSGLLKLQPIDGDALLIPHDHVVDARIVTLIDQLAYIRYSAPGLVQMTFEQDLTDLASPQPSPIGRGGHTETG